MVQDASEALFPDLPINVLTDMHVDYFLTVEVLLPHLQ